MKLFKRFFLTVLLVCSVTALGGCGIYANNKSWSDMSAGEKQEAQQNFEEIKEELSEENSIVRLGRSAMPDNRIYTE